MSLTGIMALSPLADLPPQLGRFALWLFCWEGVLCGMRKFEEVDFVEFHLQNVPQITP